MSYLALVGKYIPLQARQEFPSASLFCPYYLVSFAHISFAHITWSQEFPSATLQLQGMTSESQLRDFLLSRRLERGIFFFF